MVTKDEIKIKLIDYIIDKKLSKWNVQKPNIENELVEIPLPLDGDILLEEDIDEHGRVKGWYTMPVDGLVSLLNRRDNPLTREDGLPEEDKISNLGKRLKDLTAEEFEENSGIKYHLDKWRSEGVDI